MSSLSSILNIAQSGLQVAQTGLNVVSNNVANVNTAGYVREVVNQSATARAGVGTGVAVDSVARAANAYLEAANRSAQADAGSTGIVSSILGQAQSLFGDPSGATSFFSQLDNVFSALSTVSANPTTVAKSAAVSQLSQFLSSAQTIQSGLQTLSSQTDQRISGDIATTNQLLSQIASLNTQISQASINGQDPTGAQNQQSGLIGQLASLMNISVSTGPNGVATLRTGDGAVLADGRGSASLSYQASGTGGQISITPAGGATEVMGARLSSGELAGLMSLRDTQLPGLSSQLAQLVGQTANQLNQVSNGHASVPAPSTLAGAQTGLDQTSALSHFTGQTSVAIVNPSGVVQNQVDVDFDAGTMTVAGGASYSFTPATFADTLSTALGTSGSASFSSAGALSISAAGGNGVVVADNAGDPSSKAGRSFSSYFGLNDLVQSSAIANHDTGLQAADPSDYPAGQTLTLRLAAADGSTLKDVTVTTPAGTGGAGSTMSQLVAAMNNSATGVGLYGSFSLDASTGALSFSPTSGSGVSLSVVNDDTVRNGNGPAISTLFGLGAGGQAAPVDSYSVRSDIAANANYLQTASVDLSGGLGSTALAAGDTSGADALSQANLATASFAAAGGLSATTTTLAGYASQVGGSIAQAASAASSASDNAASVATEAKSRLSGAEGVNIDTELVSLTTYQQAYNASARLIQATKDMFDTLLSMTGA